MLKQDTCVTGAPNEIALDEGPPVESARVGSAAARPRLAPHVRLKWDRHRQTKMLLGPERGLLLDPIASEVVALCDGARTLDEIVALLAGRYPAADPSRIAGDVAGLVDALCRRRLLDGASR